MCQVGYLQRSQTQVRRFRPTAIAHMIDKHNLVIREQLSQKIRGFLKENEGSLPSSQNPTLGL